MSLPLCSIISEMVFQCVDGLEATGRLSTGFGSDMNLGHA